MLSIKNLKTSYGKNEVLHGVSFDVSGGEILAVTGENGSGKSTLLRAIAGLIPIDSGEITLGVAAPAGRSRSSSVCDFSTLTPKERAKLISVVFQTAAGAEFSEFSVFDTVLTGRFPYAKSFLSSYSERDLEIAAKYIALTELDDLKDRAITTLSGGQLQRVFLARAFCSEPRILLLDEPDNHLDLRYKKLLADILRKWITPERCVISVFHNLQNALFAERLMLLSQGEITLSGDIKTVLNSSEIRTVYGFDIRGDFLDMMKFFM
jgi:iron complex transport system ATP-binding protein